MVEKKDFYLFFEINYDFQNFTANEKTDNEESFFEYLESHRRSRKSSLMNRLRKSKEVVDIFEQNKKNIDFLKSIKYRTFYYKENQLPNIQFLSNNIILKYIYRFKCSFETFVSNFFNSKNQVSSHPFLNNTTFKILDPNILNETYHDIYDRNKSCCIMTSDILFKNKYYKKNSVISFEYDYQLDTLYFVSKPIFYKSKPKVQFVIDKKTKETKDTEFYDYMYSYDYISIQKIDDYEIFYTEINILPYSMKKRIDMEHSNKNLIFENIFSKEKLFGSKDIVDNLENDSFYTLLNEFDIFQKNNSENIFENNENIVNNVNNEKNENNNIENNEKNENNENNVEKNESNNIENNENSLNIEKLNINENSNNINEINLNTN
jgi:hypothetical protein